MSWGGALQVLALIWSRWSALPTATINPDQAYAAGIDPKREQMIQIVALALVVAVAIKVVGVLLIAVMLIIPAATARAFGRTPEQTAILAVGIGAPSALGGLQLAFVFDTPTGPTIVCVATSLFVISNLADLLGRRSGS